MNGKTNLLSFKPNMSGEVIKSIYSVGNNRGSSSYTITVKILEMFSGFLPYLTGVINHSLITSSFPDESKLAMSAYKKDDPHIMRQRYLKNNFQSNQ